VGKGEGEGKEGEKDRGGPPQCLKCVDDHLKPQLSYYDYKIFTMVILTFEL